MDQPITKPLVAWIILKNLPSSFESFSSRKYEELGRDIENINISKLVSDLISEEARFNSSINLEANKAFNNN